jgi:hypothetical protein
MEEVRLRDATQADVLRICAIHNQGIEDRAATLDVDLHTPDEQLECSAATIPVNPWSWPKPRRLSSAGLRLTSSRRDRRTAMSPICRFTLSGAGVVKG